MISTNKTVESTIKNINSTHGRIELYYKNQILQIFECLFLSNNYIF